VGLIRKAPIERIDKRREKRREKKRRDPERRTREEDGE
jgi:hypothetical protein